MRNRRLLRVLAISIGIVLGATTMTGCSDDDGTVEVTVGYQSKTINTVTAGTLLKARGYFEKALAAETEKTGVRYDVRWEDYDTGAPITAQMLAGKIDIGSMGDFPLVLNASRTYPQADARTELIATTAFNMAGGLNGIVVPSESTIEDVAGLRGATVSTSVGSAGDGLLAQTIDAAGLQPTDIDRQNQAPSVGATSLKAGSVAAYSQFAPWPAQEVWNGDGRLLVDGATTANPTFHGVVVGEQFARTQPAVVQAFLQGMSEATDYLHAQPLDAAKEVAEATGLPLEVVYLYNGPFGIANFNMALKPALVTALQKDSDYLRKTDGTIDPHLTSFADDSHLKRLFGEDYAQMLDSDINQAAPGTVQEGCGDSAGENGPPSAILWKGEAGASFYGTPGCLLAAATKADAEIRAAYVSDGLTGTRWFAEKSIWTYDPAAPTDKRWAAFATAENASKYAADKPESRQYTFAGAEDFSRASG
ncbi:ABC transporter substrate-binding protein [Clavibacter sp. CFBP 8614]|uniref:ABC transporter substrate-binding protein n=1 Tax=unclassified Clavibacter TaxID=2626594 RepID=UPI0040420574